MGQKIARGGRHSFLPRRKPRCPVSAKFACAQEETGTQRNHKTTVTWRAFPRFADRPITSGGGGGGGGGAGAQPGQTPRPPPPPPTPRPVRCCEFQPWHRNEAASRGAHKAALTLAQCRKSKRNNWAIRFSRASGSFKDKCKIMCSIWVEYSVKR
jgi:hypothetical protein